MPPSRKVNANAESRTGGSNMPATTIVLLGLFAVLRLGLVLGRSCLPPSIIDLLYSPALASALINPLYTMEHVREGIFLLNRPGAAAGAGSGGWNLLDAAYEGSVFHLPPIILALFRPLFHVIQSKLTQDIVVGILLVFVDLLVAIAIHDLALFATFGDDANSKREARLEQIMDDKIRPKRAWIFGLNARSQENQTEQKIQDPFVEMSDMPQICCLMYYCNPIAILATSCTHAPSFQGVIYMFLLIAIRESMAISAVGTKRRALRSTVFLAFASYFELYYVVYLLPMAIWIGRSNDGTQWNRGLVGLTIGLFCFWFGLLQVVSAILVKDYTSVWARTYGYVHGFFVMNPNMGLSWYFFIQMFDRFRRYFVAMFNLLQFIFVAPLAIRLHKYPIVLTTAFFLLGTLFKPVQTLHDAALGLALVAMAPRTVSRMGNASLVSLFAIIVPASLVVMFHWLWLETGTGNANYIFFQCLAYNVFLSIITLDYISATAKRDKALRLTEKIELQGGGAANKSKSD